MRHALERLAIEEPKTNVATHLRVLADGRFTSGGYDTGLLGS
jgi:biotin carboxylase